MLINKRFMLIYAIISIFITSEINAIVFERRKSKNQDIFDFLAKISLILRVSLSKKPFTFFCLYLL